MAKIKVASRVHRILSRMKRFYRNLDAFPGSPGPLPGPQDQSVLGVYLNTESSLRDAVVVTDRGLVIEAENRWVDIPYSSLESVVGPSAKVGVYHLDLELKDGRLVRLPIRGHDGRFLDVFEFYRFLKRVLEDLEPRRAESAEVECRPSGDR
jgi:hypothetical protein